MIKNRKYDNQISDFGFSNLRNNKNQLLRFSSDDYCLKYSEKISKNILKSNEFKVFIKKFNYNDIEIFVYKKVFEDFKNYLS